MIEARWTLATAAGFALAGLIPPCSGLVNLLAFGSLASLPQALILPRPARSSFIWWFNSALGVPIAFVFGVLGTIASVLLTGAPLVALGFGSVVAGFIFGALQAIGFSWHAGVRTSLHWATASAIGGPAAGAFVLVAAYGPGSCTPPVALPIFGLLLGAFYGAATSVVLRHCLERTEP